MLLGQFEPKMPEKTLYLEIILRTIMDLSNAKHIDDAMRFLNTPEFISCSEVCELDPSWIKQLVQKAFMVGEREGKTYVDLQRVLLLEPSGRGQGKSRGLSSISPDPIPSPAS